MSDRWCNNCEPHPQDVETKLRTAGHAFGPTAAYEQMRQRVAHVRARALAVMGRRHDSIYEFGQ